MRHEEEQMQAQICAWARLNSWKYPCLERLYHTPNGGKRTAAEAAALKKAGVKAGVPDLFLPYPCGGYHGLWIELKTERGVVSDHQRGWIDYLNENGYRATVCRSFDETINAIKEYLKPCGQKRHG